jgi:hypothetical protein
MQNQIVKCRKILINVSDGSQKDVRRYSKSVRGYSKRCKKTFKKMCGGIQKDVKKCPKDARRYPDKVLDKNKSPRGIQEVKNLTAEKEEKESSGIESDFYL